MWSDGELTGAALLDRLQAGTAAVLEARLLAVTALLATGAWYEPSGLQHVDFVGVGLPVCRSAGLDAGTELL